MRQFCLIALVMLGVAACSDDGAAPPPATSFTSQVQALTADSSETAEPLDIGTFVEDSSETDSPVALQ